MSIVLTVLSMHFIGVSGLRVLPLSINGWMKFVDFDNVEFDFVGSVNRTLASNASYSKLSCLQRAL